MKRVRIIDVSMAPAPGKGARVRSEDGRYLALFNVGGEFHLCEDRCPHMDSPIHDGTIVRGVVTCMWHMWQFDIASGQCLISDNIRLAKFDVEVDGGVIYAKLP
ncbi:MAG: Rieske 2Fe-2S domain-containing protein [Planctomycetes bacterium]|nr:Rieske 2Fe-2S domain-containing protein [Planctomycetota bacterium]